MNRCGAPLSLRLARAVAEADAPSTDAPETYKARPLVD
jgi:hypothetical protein